MQALRGHCLSEFLERAGFELAHPARATGRGIDRSAPGCVPLPGRARSAGAGSAARVRSARRSGIRPPSASARHRGRGPAACENGSATKSSRRFSVPATDDSSEIASRATAGSSASIAPVSVPQLRREFRRRRIATELAGQLCAHALAALQPVVDVRGQADGAGVVLDRANQRLSNPPHRIGRELEAAAMVELLHGADQAEVALLDQVRKRRVRGFGSPSRSQRRASGCAR